MKKQDLLDELDQLAASLSTLATAVNRLRFKIEAEPDEKPRKRRRPSGECAPVRWTKDASKEAIRRAIDLKENAEEIGAALNRTPGAVEAHLRKELDVKVFRAWKYGKVA